MAAFGRVTVLAVSDRFLDALRDAHGVSIAAFLFAPDALDEPIEVRVVGGEVSANRDARVLRRASLEISFTREDPAMIQRLTALPYGGYASIERGVRFADGTVERVPLGHFRVEAAVWAELEGHATLTLADRYAQVQDEPFPTPWTPEGMRPSDAIVQIVREVFGSSIAYHVETDPASEPIMVGTIYDQDRTAAISDLTQAANAEAIFDVRGDLVIRPKARPPEPVWTLDAGERGVMTKGETSLDRSSVRNGVSLRGQPDFDEPPIYALAIYDEPTSPIRWGGPFGRVVLIAESTSIATQEQADAVARSLLSLRLALAKTLTLEAVPNPALEPEDVISIVFPNGRTETQTIKETHVGLDASGALQVICKERLADETEGLAIRVLHDEEQAQELALAVVAA